MKRRRKPHRIRKKKSILRNRFFRNTVFLFFLIFAGFYFLFLSQFFQVAEIIITGSGEFLEPDIESTASLFAKNIFLTNAKEIKQALLKQFPQLAEVEVKKRFPNILNLALAERKEVGVFCEETCFLLDKKGIVFENISGDDNILTELKNDNISEKVALGDRVFDEEILETILDIDRRLKNNLSIIANEFLLQGTERLNVATSEGWEIYFNLKKDLDWQMVSLAAILKKGIPSENRSKLEYIDLRFDRIFVYPEF